MDDYFNNKSILITGGTGSFGNSLLRRLLNTDFKTIRIFSRDEKKQYDQIQQVKLLEPEKAKRIEFIIGDIRDKEAVSNAVNNIDYIFHAAALKQIPSTESFPMEAFKTNVLGTENLLRSASEAGVKAIVGLSTDKAVYPINAMGMSKAMMEKLFRSFAQKSSESSPRVCCTRYGNILCSRGSVIPLWIEQIKSGRAVTVTDPEMTRFLLDMDTAIDLVLYAFKNGNTGDILIPQLYSATMLTLAQAIIELFHPGHEIEIIGSRPGEKKAETLLTREETLIAQEQDNYIRIPLSSSKNNNSLLNFEKGYTSETTKLLSKAEVIKMLKNVSCYATSHSS